jgi:uncharacterized damage-inducible protein DinB
MEMKKGRARRYGLPPLPGFANRDIARLASGLDELRERVYDQVSHLPAAALDYVAGATQLSVGRLMLHLGWAEVNWMRRLGAPPAPADLAATLDAGALESFPHAPPRAPSAAALVGLCRRVRDEVSLPFLKTVADPDAARLDDGSTARGVLLHLTWHWIFHSGHIGLLSFEAGYDYEWTMQRPIKLD